ncbi:MAG: hypothetical protein IIC83_13255 [Chloroflexi bacterium]|nr:hypothetical protein [Chloroflexota bacterium]
MTGPRRNRDRSKGSGLNPTSTALIQTKAILSQSAMIDILIDVTSARHVRRLGKDNIEEYHHGCNSLGGTG